MQITDGSHRGRHLCRQIAGSDATEAVMPICSLTTPPNFESESRLSINFEISELLSALVKLGGIIDPYHCVGEWLGNIFQELSGVLELIITFLL